MAQIHQAGHQAVFLQDAMDKAVTFEYFLYLLNQVQQTYTGESVIAIYPDQKERIQVTFNQFFWDSWVVGIDSDMI